MKGKTAIRLAMLGAVLYTAYCMQKSGSLDDGGELKAELDQLKKELEEDIQRAKAKAAEEASAVVQAVTEKVRAAEAAAEPEQEAAPLPEENAGPAGIPNPYKEYTEAEFREICPKELNYMDIAEDRPIFYTVDGEKTLYGAKLLDADCLEYDFRMQHGRGDADISGMYYDWTQEIKYPENKPECTVYLNDSGQGICLWKDRSYRYSLAMKEGASLVKLVWMRKRIV